jgi:hypothetical protein
MLRISKIDTNPIPVAKASGIVENFLSQVEITIEVIKAELTEVNGTVVELETDELAEAMRSIYKNKIINQQEQSPVELREGRLILKTTITRIESIKATGLTYGFLIEETMFKCVPHENAKSKLKIKGGELEKK